MLQNPEQLLLWCGASLVAANKPSGLLTLPHGYDPSLPHLRSVLEPTFGRLWIVHRLDRETSEIVVLARTADAYQHLNTQFQEKRAFKVYHALVAGQPPWENTTITNPLHSDSDRRHRTVVDPLKGRSAVTELRVLRRFEGYSLLEAAPLSGRTHQIRAYLKHIGYPILADPLYGDRTHLSHNLLQRLGLHALSLTLIHPKTKETMIFEAPYPHDFSSML
ncbi:MAG: hypothetical protein A2Z14_05575 [Chloroflexi bacterium RBG_16_48_8]|nr:MAG: hypothetical protein A2Z14_05575 [Chloroflexi bacterium RBG_16_48_8]